MLSVLAETELSDSEAETCANRSFSNSPMSRRVVINAAQEGHFPLNKVTNTKYNALTFIPLNLYEQFGLEIKD
jgi:hypothetical protein